VSFTCCAFPEYAPLVITVLVRSSGKDRKSDRTKITCQDVSQATYNYYCDQEAIGNWTNSPPGRPGPLDIPNFLCLAPQNIDSLSIYHTGHSPLGELQVRRRPSLTGLSYVNSTVCHVISPIRSLVPLESGWQSRLLLASDLNWTHSASLHFISALCTFYPTSENFLLNFALKARIIVPNTELTKNPQSPDGCVYFPTIILSRVMPFEGDEESAE